jgi:erythromycin esterase
MAGNGEGRLQWTGQPPTAMTRLARPVSRPRFFLVLLYLCSWFLAGGPAPVGAPARAAAQGVAPRPVKGAPAAPPAATAAATTRTDLTFATEERRRQWRLGGEGYDVAFDSQETRPAGGGPSLRLALRPGTALAAKAFGVGTTRYPVDAARGRHLRLEGWIKTSAIAHGWAGLWLRADGPGGVVAFDNMGERGIRGTTSWSRVEVEVDVPPEASAIFLGVILAGDGTAWVSDLALSVEPIRPAVPVVVEGRVEDPAGRPVGGALVAVIPSGSSRAAAVVRTGGDGTFRTSVAKGRYALTATAVGFAAAFEPPSDVRDAAPRGVTLKLGAGCVNVIGKTESAGALPPAGTRVAAGRVSDQDGDLFYAELDGRGTFSLCLSPARYRIALETPDYIGKPVAVELARGGADQRVTLAAGRLEPAPDEVVSWLRGHVVPLRTAVAGQGFDDLRPLAGMIGKARIVALGEATHGTREFFQLKHRLLEYLVSELGFTVFAIEANWPESLAVDEYVMHGTGDPGKALAGLYFWTWNTEEVLDMIRWMRAYNADPAHARKVRFLGFDMQTARVAGPVVAAYLQRVDPGYGKQMSSSLATLSGDGLGEGPPAESAAAFAAAKALLARFDQRKDAYVAASSLEEWDAVRQHAVIVEQAAELADVKRHEYRDRAMADNIGWILSRQPAGTRMVAWAHNGHINYGTGRGYVPMGECLRQKFGADYLSIGFAFNQGAFQAIGSNGHWGLSEFSLGPSPDSNLAAAFSRTGIPLSLLDLRRRPTAGPVAAWLATPHPMRETGAVFLTEADMTLPTVITDRFDALLFVDRTTRARPNGRPRASEPGGGLR